MTRGSLIKMNGGIGDMLLLTVITRKIFHETGKKVSMFSLFPELFNFNSSIGKIYSKESFPYKALRPFMKNFHEVTYRCWSSFLPHKKNIFKTHVIEQFCHQLGLSGKVHLKPEVFYNNEEVDSLELPTAPYVVVQSQASHSNHPQTTKDWDIASMQKVVDALSKHFLVVQLGDQRDTCLNNVVNLTGQTSFREAGIILRSSILFVGLEGALMHLARAVDCPSVIVWGGRLKPSQIGYPCFENLTYEIECSPCWIPNACPKDLECMKRIRPDQVIEASHRILDNTDRSLPVDEIFVEPVITPEQMRREILEFPPHLDHLVQRN